jgi:hypothetical protein
VYTYTVAFVSETINKSEGSKWISRENENAHSRLVTLLCGCDSSSITLGQFLREITVHMLTYDVRSAYCADFTFINSACRRQIVTAIPLQVWTGPEGSRRLRLLDFKTRSGQALRVPEG